MKNYKKKKIEFFFDKLQIFFVKKNGQKNIMSGKKGQVTPAGSTFAARSVGNMWHIAAEKPRAEGYREETWPVLVGEDNE